MPKTAQANRTSSLEKDIQALRQDADDFVDDAAKVVRSAGREAYKEISAQRDDLTESLTNYIVEKPLTSVGIAAAAGFILAKIWR